MSYRIKKREVLSVALSRIVAEEIDLAVTELNRNARGEGIHSARKAIKRVRALLRALRPAFPGKLYRTQDRRLAEAGRRMSPARDVHVQLRTLESLQASGDRAAGRMRRDLLRRQREIDRKVSRVRDFVRWTLGYSRGVIKSWPMDSITPKELAKGLRRIYKQGRLACAKTCQNPTPENLHELRKKVKALAYGLGLVENVVPKKIAKKIRRCEKLGDILGDDHDLFMVRQALLRTTSGDGSRDHASLLRRITMRRADLEKRALKMGKKIYSEKPRVFVTRLKTHLARK